jgi:hypothetical protein
MFLEMPRKVGYNQNAVLLEIVTSDGVTGTRPFVAIIVILKQMIETEAMSDYLGGQK